MSAREQSAEKDACSCEECVHSTCCYCGKPNPYRRVSPAGSAVSS